MITLRMSFLARLRMLLLLAGLGWSLPSSRATLLLYEPFSYPNGTEFGSNARTNGWGIGNPMGPDGTFATNSASLTYSNLATLAGSAGLVVAGTPATDRNAGCTNFPPLTLNSNNPSIYLSFLLNVQSPTTVTNYRMLASLYCQDQDVGAIAGAGVCIDAANHLRVTKKSNTPDTSPTAALSTGTHLIVLRYRRSGGDDPASLWVDPVNLGVAENNVPTASASSSGHDNVSGSFRAAYIYQSASYSGSYYVDELRVGTTWADVTPIAVLQTVDPNSSLITLSSAVTNLNGTVLVTVMERDSANSPMTNASVVPELTTTLGTLSAPVFVTNGIYTATLTSASIGYASVSGAINGTPIANGLALPVYFAGPVPELKATAGFFPGTYNFVFPGDPSQSFSVWSTTNPALPMAQWNLETDLATGYQTMYESIYPGELSSYSFVVQPPGAGMIFYRVQSP